ncbi:tRNA (adenosine(37)-N6)-dimethylallyltransferase MiaA [Sediminitomix flava]|uniref:tRNA dimethylallyltransferase n=1 Tax=Sediminitomix flava TaxID=379075 RepID=A0A315Z9G4_SEDFL|nr:tRNA (adenosine(37)-N6)-dimethylallyltransferase MiaA [Sediminitomix flava]PWJ42151.1 tRNA dimethylallyltransferase [Sediminitomix flava]
MQKDKLTVILGPTASGKTHLAVHLANDLGGEVISADSRQVYRKMDIGTGKDLNEYTLGENNIPYHLIDICEPGEKYLLSDFQKDFKTSYQKILSNNHYPILCGGTGLYIQSILENYQYAFIPNDQSLRDSLDDLTQDQLLKQLDLLPFSKEFHDRKNRKRTIRAIEIGTFLKDNPNTDNISKNELEAVIIGIDIDRDTRRSKISNRLKERLQEGMIEEVESLLKYIPSEDLIYYGLEYKFLTEYLLGKLTYDEMYQKLESGIHQYAKRQMTWFRGMERKGYQINWLSFDIPTDEKVQICKELILKKV